jgi:hypothetical protein
VCLSVEYVIDLGPVREPPLGRPGSRRAERSAEIAEDSPQNKCGDGRVNKWLWVPVIYLPLE